MAKFERGTKRQCLTCATKFYDLTHDPILCPKCGATFTIEVLATRKAPIKEDKPKKEEPVATETEVEEAAPAESETPEDSTETVSLEDVAKEEAASEETDSDDDSEDDELKSLADIDDVEVDDSLGGGDTDNTFLDTEDDENNVELGVTVTKDEDV